MILHPNRIKRIEQGQSKAAHLIREGVDLGLAHIAFLKLERIAPQLSAKVVIQITHNKPCFAKVLKPNLPRMKSIKKFGPLGWKKQKVIVDKTSKKRLPCP